MILQFPAKADAKDRLKTASKAESKFGSDSGSFIDTDYDAGLPSNSDYQAFGWYLDDLIWKANHF